MARTVPVGKAVVSGRQHCGVQDMRAILAEMLGGRIWDEVSIQDLLHCEVVEWDRRKRPVGLEPLYELRYREFGASQMGIVGHMTHGMFRDWVDFTMESILKQLRAEQPGCEWRLAAALVDQQNLRTVVPVPFRGRGVGTGAKAILRSLADHDENDTETVYALDRRTDYQQVADYRWQVRTVWADAAQGELVDPQVALGAHPGPMTKYIEDRQLRRLTEGMRQIRRKCEATLREYEERLIVQEEEWVDVQQAFETRAPVSAAAPEITPEQVAAAFELRNQGVNLHLVATAMRLPVEKLEPLVEALLERKLSEVQAKEQQERNARKLELDDVTPDPHVEAYREVEPEDEKPRPTRSRKIPT